MRPSRLAEKPQTSWLRKQHFTFLFFFPRFDFVYFLYNFFWLADRLAVCVCVCECIGVYLKIWFIYFVQTGCRLFSKKALLVWMNENNKSKANKTRFKKHLAFCKMFDGERRPEEGQTHRLCAIFILFFLFFFGQRKHFSDTILWFLCSLFMLLSAGNTKLVDRRENYPIYIPHNIYMCTHFICVKDENSQHPSRGGLEKANLSGPLSLRSCNFEWPRKIQNIKR